MTNGLIINGTTRVCGLIGQPVEHTFSPLIQNTAFAALNLNYVYLPFQVFPEHLGVTLAAVRALNLAGINVTIPHKEAVLTHLDEVDQEARLMGAVNTVVNRAGRLVGYNTDGRGFLEAVTSRTEFEAEGSKVLLLGAGGAARAVAIVLALAGAKQIIIANRSKVRAWGLVRVLSEHTPVRAGYMHWKPANRVFAKDLCKIAEYADLIVQCTPVGMYPAVDHAPEFPFRVLQPRQLVCDLVYNPVRTKFLIAAEAAGAQVVDGLEMLVRQGAIAFELWTGRKAPVEVMREALELSLNRERR